MVPTDIVPPGTSSTLQVTFATEAVNCWICVVVVTAARKGETVTGLPDWAELAVGIHARRGQSRVILERLFIPGLPQKGVLGTRRISFSAEFCLLGLRLN
jgi:hypothetical protein